MSQRPKKPFATYPLFAHANGQWAKKILGKTHYFGKWADPNAARDKYKAEHAYLFAGEEPPIVNGTVASVVRAFLDTKATAVATGDLAQRSYDEYEKTCGIVQATLGKSTPVGDVEREVLIRLRLALIKGKRGRVRSPVSQKRYIGMARVLFNFVNEALGHSIHYRIPLKMPPAKSLRAARNVVGERLFTPDEINGLVAHAKPQLKAMILLGINCGFGNQDCATLPIEQVDIRNGWHTYWRPKTQVARRCPLWPETTAALYTAIKNRDSGQVFVTKYGNPWEGKGRADPISYEFRKLVTKLKMRRDGITTFYTLRRTFETIGATTGDQIAVNFIMGHAPSSSDMAAVYRQRTFDSQLHRVVDHIHDWLQGRIILA
jgi:integrase